MKITILKNGLKKLRYFFKFLIIKKKCQANTQLFVFLTLPPLSPNPQKSWISLIYEYFNLWPWYQWVSSIIGLIFLYLVMGHYFDKWLRKRSHWFPHGAGLAFKTRVWLIILDLTINFAVGFYVMQSPKSSPMYMFMAQCPIALSPGIFVIELICVFIFFKFIWKGGATANNK